ncbi:unnamed protein product [Camellia sinensis]
MQRRICIAAMRTLVCGGHKELRLGGYALFQSYLGLVHYDNYAISPSEEAAPTIIPFGPTRCLANLRHMQHPVGPPSPAQPDDVPAHDNDDADKPDSDQIPFHMTQAQYEKLHFGVYEVMESRGIAGCVRFGSRAESMLHLC